MGRNTLRNWAFIDGQKLKLDTTRAQPSWNIDLSRFRTYLDQKYNVSKAYYFIGAYEPKYQTLYDALRKYGFIVMFREHTENSLSKKKGNVDTDIVFEIMKDYIEENDFNKVILVSGDGDYWRMVDYLIKKNKFEKLLVPNRRMLSSLYRHRMADSNMTYLDNPETKNKIILKKK